MKAIIKETGQAVEVVSRFMPRKRNAASRDWVCNLSDGTCIDESQLEYIEEPVEGLDAEIERFKEKVGCPLYWCDEKEQSEWVSIIARHFAEWQKEQDQQKCHGCFNRDEVFMRGMKYAKEQMMEEAVDADVMLTLHDKTGDISLHTGYLPKELGIKCDDKVRIIILKDNEDESK